VGIKFANNASGTLASGILAGDTAIPLTAGHGARFPALGAGDFFFARLKKASGVYERIKVTARAGDNLTATRAQDGTAAVAFSAGDEIRLTWGKGDAEYLRDNLNAPSGTRMSFQQTTAPTGWTKEVGAAYDNASLRLVTGAAGTGGADAFTTVFGTGKTSGGHSITQAELPAVTFGTVTYDPANGAYAYLVRISNPGETVTAQGLDSNGSGSDMSVIDAGRAATLNQAINSGGSGTAHTHPLTGMDLKYADFIIAQKD
jgi:hypothetical protein